MTQTVGDAIRGASQALSDVSDAPRQEAEWLMAHALATSREAMVLRHMRDEAPPGFAGMLTRRLGGEPLAHILGTQPFYGMELEVTPDVLIPRADSETLIEAALSADADPARVLDCGTGSGALLLAALRVWPLAIGVGMDISDAALVVARGNARKLGLDTRATFERGDWTRAGWSEEMGRFDLVLANPPYVETDDPDLDPQVALHEPGLALFAGTDGMDAYRKLLPAMPELLTPGGIACVEIGMRQGDAVVALARAAGMDARIVEDTGHRPRAVLLRVQGGG